MHIIIFEDRYVLSLEPLTLTRAAFDLICGPTTLLQHQLHHLGAGEVGVMVRADLADLTRERHPNLAVNDAEYAARDATVLVNARWIPPVERLTDLASPRVGLVGGEAAYVVLPRPGLPEVAADAIGAWVDRCRDTLPTCPAGGVMIRHAWNLVEHNPQSLCEAPRWWPTPALEASREWPQVVGPRDQVFVDPTAQIDPFVIADARNGPVLVDRGARVQSFSRLEGPCYVGPESWILGAKLRGGTVGPECRVGGEVEASILHAHANKYHDGFLGHSYVGEWVNLAAGTQISDLRNDYGMIRCSIRGERVLTGLTKVGAFFGDHLKTGLNTLINPGSVFGAFCNLLPTGNYMPPVVPSFCAYQNGQLQERWDLRQLFATADTVMRRRGQELSSAYTDFVFTLYEQTAVARAKAIREGEMRRLRRSM